MIEEWRPVVGWEGLYEVSSLGRVRSVKRVVVCKDGKAYCRKERMMSLRKNAFGYLRVKLSKDGNSKLFMTHRLVAGAFVPNTENLPFVNHKDEVKSNNRYDNLEWCTRLYNTRYGTNIERIRKSHINNKKLSKSVSKCNLSGIVLETYPSMSEAARQNYLSEAKISLCCQKKRKTHGGYKWKLA